MQRIIQFWNVFFSDVPKTMWLKKHKADHISPNKKGQNCSKSTQKSAQDLSKSEERGEQLRENCKVICQNQNPFILPENSWALAAYYAENTSLPTALVEISPKEMRSPRRPRGQRKSGKICIYLNVSKSQKLFFNLVEQMFTQSRLAVRSGKKVPTKRLVWDIGDVLRF